MKFIEGARVVTESELQANNITRHHVTKYYRNQITNGGYYEQLKNIVEPSVQEFESRGSLDTSGGTITRSCSASSDLPLHFHPAAVRVSGFFAARPNFGPPGTRVLRL
ncbi:hypothetical protein [Bradyrhizobium sp. NBAIM02]|uniref:hypothetical protein n=1 Tax=Bradyrhizobium sp. NBAIM02 TaxID=2793817 RepID=UPI001CD2C95B|nr:hypothetical protein [Bradyrhizobium sp. NBAIM02]